MERLTCDVVVIGGGHGGCVVAGRLAAESEAEVILLEAGPDYGPRDSGALARRPPRRGLARRVPRLGLRHRRPAPLARADRAAACPGDRRLLRAQRLHRRGRLPGGLRRLGSRSRERGLGRRRVAAALRPRDRAASGSALRRGRDRAVPPGLPRRGCGARASARGRPRRPRRRRRLRLGAGQRRGRRPHQHRVRVPRPGARPAQPPRGRPRALRPPRAGPRRGRGRGVARRGRAARPGERGGPGRGHLRVAGDPPALRGRRAGGTRPPRHPDRPLAAGCRPEPPRPPARRARLRRQRPAPDGARRRRRRGVRPRGADARQAAVEPRDGAVRPPSDPRGRARSTACSPVARSWRSARWSRAPAAAFCSRAPIRMPLP